VRSTAAEAEGLRVATPRAGEPIGRAVAGPRRGTVDTGTRAAEVVDGVSAPLVTAVDGDVLEVGNERGPFDGAAVGGLAGVCCVVVTV
jgi:hypothetical protein